MVQFLGRDLPALYSAERAAEGKFTYTLTRMRDLKGGFCLGGGDGGVGSVSVHGLSFCCPALWYFPC